MEIIVLIAVIVIMAIPFFIEWYRVHTINSEWQRNNAQKAVQMLIEDINRAKKRILIFGGCDDIYNNDGIIQSMLTAAKRGVSVELVFEKEPRSRKIKQLPIQSEKINVAFTNDNMPHHHFRVVDYNYVYLEKSHPINSQDRFYKRLPNTRFLPGDYSKEFAKIREHAVLS